MKSDHLERFIIAQKVTFQIALNEIKAGRKQSHWMWYIFPQIQGLGFSETTKYYAIADLAEAIEYLSHEVLGPRLILMCSILLNLQTNDALQVFGSPDDLKLKSSMTLFSAVPGADPIFEKILQKYFSGLKDQNTLKILSQQD